MATPSKEITTTDHKPMVNPNVTDIGANTDSMTNFVLHVGLPKTGTTTLQMSLYAKHPDVYYLGKQKGTGIDRACTSQTALEALTTLLWNHREPVNKIAGEKLLALVRERDPKPKVVVESWEGLSERVPSHVAESIKRCISVFGNCRMMICLRNPIHKLESQYLQQLRGNFLHMNRNWVHDGYFIDFDTWLQQTLESPTRKHPFSYCELIRQAAEILGNANVGVFVFEELCKNPERFTVSVCEFLGIDSQQGVELMKQQHLHPRMTEAQVEFLRRLEGSAWRQWWMKFTKERMRNRTFEKLSDIGPPAKAVMSDTWKQKISQSTCEGHRWLMDTFGLDLEGYGYPV